ncbi:uncharacterized protein LOC114365084 isoform X2 [Ostrinia furnacalis]|uniref:uncharacterized protein LOC114365084 isoform X2 n=1 Tax=Ostrinia furnacalis TaxID=93504 RepID=UPI0010403F59|nr:uncharacterized protein LOC114365084 isoform X2 [Ostrinia furnacalis]
MDWNKETILSFIGFIRERPAIWNTQSRDHKIKNKRHDALAEVAMLMGISIKEVNVKWTILRNQFSREKRKMMGSSADSVYKTKWYAYKEMEDLMSCNTPIVYINNSERTTTPPPPQRTPTPPRLLTQALPSKPPLPKKKKRETDGQSSFYKEAVETLRVIRERKNISQNPADDLTSFGLYIAARLRQYSPHLQCKASIDDSDSPFSPDFKTTWLSTADDQYEEMDNENSITHTSDN